MRRVTFFFGIAAVLMLASCAGRNGAPSTRTNSEPNPSEMVHARPLDQAIADGVAFLVADQNRDGSWGTGTVSHGNEVEVSVPGSHEAFRVATTSLCVMALRSAGEHAAHNRGVEYLLSHPDVKRADASLIYNVWAHAYIIEALSEESSTNHDPRLVEAVNYNLDRMARYETYTGGWNYYDFNAGTQQPAGGPTSFGTAAGLAALFSARDAGFSISPAMIQRGTRRLEEMRLPNGGFLYDTDLKYRPILRANLPRGSAGRAVAANFALLLWKSPRTQENNGLAALDLFFQEHAALEMGRKRPMPHESWYQVSGYYYYFDHYYAARLIEMLGPDAKKKYVPRLLDAILPHQEPDGSWWDYPMWDYHKPYGTAFALMSLCYCR